MVVLDLDMKLFAVPPVPTTGSSLENEARIRTGRATVCLLLRTPKLAPASPHARLSSFQTEVRPLTFLLMQFPKHPSSADMTICVIALAGSARTGSCLLGTAQPSPASDTLHLLAAFPLATVQYKVLYPEPCHPR